MFTSSHNTKILKLSQVGLIASASVPCRWLLAHARVENHRIWLRKKERKKESGRKGMGLVFAIIRKASVVI